MLEIFRAYISAQGGFNNEELDRICSVATQRKLRRKQLVLLEGEICRHKIFVAQGLLKNYRVRDDGTESILRFAPENTWTTDHESLTKQIPSRNNIEALEDSQVLLWTIDDLNDLLDAIPAFKAYTDRFITNALDASYQRIHVNISYTSEEKYDDFVSSFPDLFNRVPLHMVASYLGVSRETLSRIRQGRVRQDKDL